MWEEGQFHFEESTLPEKERITVDLDIASLILAGIRRVDANGRGARPAIPEGTLVLERGGRDAPPRLLEPYEEHVLELIDGERSVLEICRESEIGDNETLKVLYALISSGIVRVKGKKVRTLDQDFVPEDTLYSVMNSFNQMYGYVFRYMVREVGPIAENVLEKYLARPAREPQGRLRGGQAPEGRLARRRARGAQPQQAPGGGAARPARGRLQRAALRRAPRREAHAGRRARDGDHQGLPRELSATPAQVRGAVLVLLAVLLLLACWRLWTLP